MLGLLALMCCRNRARRPTSATGDLILLEDQDRSLWNRIRSPREGVSSNGRWPPDVGPYTIQAAIAAVHAEAPTTAATDWARIVGLYDLLWRTSHRR